MTTKTMSVADARFLEYLRDNPKHGAFNLTDEPHLERLWRNGYMARRNGFWEPTKAGLASASGVLFLLRGDA